MTLRDILRNAVRATANLLPTDVVCPRSLRRGGLDYVVLPIRGSYPERTVRRDPLPFPFNRLSLFPQEVSLADVRAMAETIGNDRRVQGAVLRFDTLQASLSARYSLRRILLDLRARGKRLIAWLPTANTWDYYLASACDAVVLPESGHLSVLGVRAEPVFLKDALALAGVEADLETIAEYKVTPDTFRRSTMSEPHREMLDALLDSLFEEMVTAVAEGRELGAAQVRELIDTMPLTASEATEAGLIDAVLYEDELDTYLELSTRLHTWHEAGRWLRKPIRWSTRQAIGVVPVEGLIVPGRSRRVPMPVPVPLPFGEAQAGAETIVGMLRRAEADKHIAAVVLHVETPGGSALASDLICREVERLRARKPVVALMGGQATSGGYYVSALANRIVARPTTLTGSIGIWGGKFVLAGLHEKLGVHREPVQRGAMAGLYSEMLPFSEAERAWVRRDMGNTYARFKARVAEGRGLSDEQVEAIARGRVWTGTQALKLGLVDELGDFETALAAAKELAGLKPEREYTVTEVHPPRHTLAPQPFPLPEGQTLSVSSLGTLLETLQGLARERVWALAPWTIRVQG